MTAPLIRLGGDCEVSRLVEAVLVRRPSARNRSPYVADVLLGDGREALCHVPSLELGGKAGAGATILMRRATDTKGVPVAKEAVSAKYGTPKCEFICLLAALPGSTGWVGAHPSLGERAAASLLGGSAAVLTALTGGSHLEAYEVSKEVARPCGADMRSDFVLTPPAAHDRRKVIVEVKTVVDSSTDALPQQKMTKRETAKKLAEAPLVAAVVESAHFTNPAPSATFPWGRANQKFDDEKVVSARSLKHMGELSKIARGDLHEEGTRVDSALLFVAVRSDVLAFKPNNAACPAFGRHLHDAMKAGVRVHARRVRWRVNDDKTAADAYDDGPLPIVLD